MADYSDNVGRPGQKRPESENAVELCGYFMSVLVSFLVDFWYVRAGLAYGVLSRKDCTWLALRQQSIHGDTVQFSFVQIMLLAQLLTFPHTEQWRRLAQAFL